MSLWCSSLPRIVIAVLTTASITYAADPTFILKNGSSASAIQINIMQYGNSISGGLISIAKGDEYATNIPVANNPTTIELHYCRTASSCKTELPEKLIAQFPKGKTIYIKFDGKHLEAQKGSFGKTTGKYSGLNMDNNIKTNEIKITHAKTLHGPQSIENEAWEHFPISNKDNSNPDKDINPDYFWTTVLGLDYGYIIKLPLDQSYDPIMHTAHKNYTATVARLTKIEDPRVRDKAKEIAKTALDNSISFIQNLKDIRLRKKPKPQSSPQTTPQEVPQSSVYQRTELAWQTFPQANALRLRNGDVHAVSRLVLGVATNASKAEIAKAYKVGVLLYHPDKYNQLSQQKQNKLPKDQAVRDEVFKIFDTAYKDLR